MATAGIVGFWVGAFLLSVFTPWATRVHRNHRWMWRTATTATLTCAQLRETTLTQVAVAARTRHRSWTETLEQREYPNGEISLQWDWGLVEPVVIEDETGTAVLSRALAFRNLTRGRDRLVKQEPGRRGGSSRTWQVPGGVAVYVIGSLSRDKHGDPLLCTGFEPGAAPVAEPLGGGGTSTATPEDVLDHFQAVDSRWAAIAQTAALVGLSLISIVVTSRIAGIH